MWEAPSAHEIVSALCRKRKKGNAVRSPNKSEKKCLFVARRAGRPLASRRINRGGLAARAYVKTGLWGSHREGFGRTRRPKPLPGNYFPLARDNLPLGNGQTQRNGQGSATEEAPPRTLGGRPVCFIETWLCGRGSGLL